ncbi:MAG TPA: sugar phosphorylase [Anaerolineales bacterium]|nr:sugar phosphorylase [Anaerolineales bacterium]
MTDLSADLAFLYGTEQVPQLAERVEKLIAHYRRQIPARPVALTEKDCVLITYGDQVQSPNERPLQTLGAFCQRYLSGLISGIHILPFFPSTSDDGFSVVDYRQVNSSLGDWNDIACLQRNFRLMFDGVINHASSQSEWFKGFLRDDPRYRSYFIEIKDSPDLSQVIRPRTLPLWSTFQTPSGEKRVWTTFGSDQIDLNYKNPEVLLEMLDILLMYAERGATFIRLDAIAYLWKEIGTPCIHLPQTHRVIQFLRAVLDQAAPHVQLITETNVAHADNVSYFGDGTDEAQLVYNFALPALILHTFRTGQVSVLSHWAKTLTLPSDKTTFLNFLASHDGIGLNAARGILSDDDIQALIRQTLEHGGRISYKQNSDGSQSPYEMNINYFDALSNPAGNESLDLQVDRFIAAQAIMLSLIGVAGIYFHSLFGSRGWIEGVKQTGHNRTINREKCQLLPLQRELADKESMRARVFARYRRLLLARTGSPAFHAHGSQSVLNFHPAVFAIQRISPEGTSQALCLHNVQAQEITFRTSYASAIDLFTDQPLQVSELTLKPYQVLWVKL